MMQLTKSGRFLACALAMLFVATGHAAAARAHTAVTITFNDLSGDGIRSDGLGGYAGTVGGRNGTLRMSTGEDSLFFDFSNAVYPGAVTPFGSVATSGYLSGVDMTADYVDGDAGTSGWVLVLFSFVAPAPDGSGPTDWVLSMWMVVDRQDTSGDGLADTFVLSRPVADPYPVYAGLAWHTDPVREPQKGPRRYPPYKDDGWRAGGTFDMDWGAVIGK